jgi:DNA-binding ferritin-like protein
MHVAARTLSTSPGPDHGYDRYRNKRRRPKDDREWTFASARRGQEAVVRTARSIFPSVERVNDEPTADLLTQRMQVHEKTTWMLRSLLEQ